MKYLRGGTASPTNLNLVTVTSWALWNRLTQRAGRTGRKNARRHYTQPRHRFVRCVREVGVPDLPELRTKLGKFRCVRAPFDARPESADVISNQKDMRKASIYRTCEPSIPSQSFRVLQLQLDMKKSMYVSMIGVVKVCPTYPRLRSHRCEKSHRESVPHPRRNKEQTRHYDLNVSHLKVRNMVGPQRTLVILANPGQVDALLNTDTF